MKFALQLLLIFSFLPFFGGDIAEDPFRILKNEISSQLTEKVVLPDPSGLTVTTVASHLDVPWEIVWGPDNWIWFTEQSGTVSKVNPETGEQKLLLRIIPDVYRNRTLGLLCMTLHPDMKNFPYVFLNYTYMKRTELRSRWVRYTYTGTSLTDPLILLELPADVGHNGSRILVAPDGKLMLATGDADVKNEALNSGNAQKVDVLSGKILRMNIDGTIPSDNPFPGSAVWAMGFRVPQGLVYASNGNLYSAEHGNATDDEINLIKKGGNYGYPKVMGACDKPEEKEFCAAHSVTEPIIAWTPTVAAAGLDYYDHSAIPEWKNSLLLATLKGQGLRVVKLNEKGDRVIDDKVYFEKTYGRLRDVCISPAGDVYISTSNRDWNPVEGFPVDNDDRILKISRNNDPVAASRKPAIKEKTVTSSAAVTPAKPLSAGAELFNSYCASCHKSDGTGVPGTFPPLKGAPQVKGDKEELIRIVLQGLSGPIEVHGVKYDMQMPGFSFLSDRQVADVVEYVRSEFGNKAGKITSAEVNKVKSSTNK